MFSDNMLGRDHGDLPRRPITRIEYERMVEVGILAAEERIELLRGAIVAMSPIGDPHVQSVSWLVRLLVRQLGDEWQVQPQCPLRLWDHSAPEPDVAVVPVGSFRRPASSCALVVEVADSSVRIDSTIKAALYAEAAIPVYWLVDLANREVLVYSEPRDGAYRSIDRRRPGDVLVLEGQPAVAVPVAEIVPPA